MSLLNRLTTRLFGEKKAAGETSVPQEGLSVPFPQIASQVSEMTTTNVQCYLEDSTQLTIKELIEIMQDRIMYRTSYFGVRAIKNPLDFWVYQEIIFERKPDVIIEIGNHYGGSTLALAHLCDLSGKGRVIGIDTYQTIVQEPVRKHPRITLIEEDACLAISKVRRLINRNDEVLVIEDSAHTFDNTLNVMRTYGPLIKPGGYMIVEDGNCHHGLDAGPYPGPYEAIEAFMQENDSFVIDRSREDFLLTWNPKGFLKKVK